MLNLLLALLGIFVLFCIVARLLHRYFIYVPDPKRVDPKEIGLAPLEEIVFKATDGTKLIAWYQPAKPGKPTLLYLPGNSGSVAARVGKIRAIAASGYGFLYHGLPWLWRIWRPPHRGAPRGGCGPCL